MANRVDASFVKTLPPNVAVQFLDRVASSPDQGGLPLSRRRELGVGHLEARPATEWPGWLPG